MDIIGDNGPNRLVGTPDADDIDGHGGSDVLAGREGDDRIEGGDSPIGTFFTSGGAALGSAIGGLGGPLGSAVGGVFGAAIGRVIDTERAGSNSDFLFGEDGKDTLLGQRGNDFLHGGADDDSLDGGLGADILVGGPGHDRLDGGPGDDRLNGSEGGDDFIFDINSLGSQILFGPGGVTPTPVGIAAPTGTGTGFGTAAPTGTGTGVGIAAPTGTGTTGGFGVGTAGGFGVGTAGGLFFSNQDTVVDFSRDELERDRIFVDSINPSSAQFVVDNARPFDVITDADRNVDAVPQGLRLDFGQGNTLTILGVTSLTVGEDIFFI